jgi:hypothetical protein
MRMTKERLEKKNAEDGAETTITVGTGGLGEIKETGEAKAEAPEILQTMVDQIEATTGEVRLGARKEGEVAIQCGTGGEEEVGIMAQGGAAGTQIAGESQIGAIAGKGQERTVLGNEENDGCRLHQPNKSEYHLHPHGHRTKINQSTAAAQCSSMFIKERKVKHSTRIMAAEKNQ